MKQDPKLKVIKPPTEIKYKKFCKKIFNKYHKHYIYYINSKPAINIVFLMSILVNKLKPHVNEKYVRHKTYNEIDFIKGIIEILDNCTYWTRYKGTVPGKYLNGKHNDYCKWGVYECLYGVILLTYFSTNKFNKLHNQCIDSTFVKNLYGCDIYGRFKQCKSKNGVKISLVTDCNGVPISIATAAANEHDATIACVQLNNMLIDAETTKVKNNNKYKQFMLGDGIYHNQYLYELLRKKGYTPRTDINIRRTKNVIIIKYLTKEKRKYEKKQRKRLVIERCNAWIHKYPKLDRLIEKSLTSYNGLLLLGLSFIVSKKIE